MLNVLLCLCEPSSNIIAMEQSNNDSTPFDPDLTKIGVTVAVYLFQQEEDGGTTHHQKKKH